MGNPRVRNARVPTITFSIGLGSPMVAQVEVEFPPHRMEGWVLYSQIADCRRLYNLTERLLPLMKAATLLIPNQDVETLEALLKSQPKLTAQRREQYLRQQRILEEQQHNPNGVRKNPVDRLFKL